MKTYSFVILAVLFLYIQNDCEIQNETVSNKEVCWSRTFSEEEKNEKKYEHCCYVKYKFLDENHQECDGLDKDDYDNIKKYLKYVKMMKIDVETLDCKSSYLKLGALALIFLIF